MSPWIQRINDTASSHKSQYRRLKKVTKKLMLYNSVVILNGFIAKSFQSLFEQSMRAGKLPRGRMCCAEKRVSSNFHPKARRLINRPCCGNFSQFKSCWARISHRNSSARRRWYLRRDKVYIFERNLTLGVVLFKGGKLNKTVFIAVSSASSILKNWISDNLCRKIAI